MAQQRHLTSGREMNEIALTKILFKYIPEGIMPSELA